MLARVFLIAALMPFSAAAQTSTFTYQGYLTEAGTAAEGAFDFELALYNVDSGGTAIDVNAFNDVTVTGGLFSLPADFTGAPFETGGNYWVEARVRDGASIGAFTPLLPRQAVNASPYAIAAQAVIAPLDVAGDANVQGALAVGGDAGIAGEMRAQRVEADEIWSDGPVDLLGGVVAERFGDAVALLVKAAGGTQPALRVEVGSGVAVSLAGDLELNGELGCPVGGCIPRESLAFPVYSARDQVQRFSSTKSLGAGFTGSISVACAAETDLVLFGDCPNGGQGNLKVIATRYEKVHSGTTGASAFECTYQNDGLISSGIESRIYCASAP